MEINYEKSKTMVNSKNNQKANIYQERILLENVETFKYLGAILKIDGSSDNELRIRIATATSAIIRQFDSSIHSIIWMRNLDVIIK